MYKILKIGHFDVIFLNNDDDLQQPGCYHQRVKWRCEGSAGGVGGLTPVPQQFEHWMHIITGQSARFVTTHNCTPSRPIDLKIYKAWSKLAWEILSNCSLNNNVSSNSTPKIFIQLTFWIPGMNRGISHFDFIPCVIDKLVFVNE